jgi:hypothetical protein
MGRIAEGSEAVSPDAWPLPEGVTVDEVSSSVNVTIMWGIVLDSAQVASFTGILR